MRPASSFLRHALAWAALWGFWAFVSRHNHPSLLLDVAATTLLVATFALAVYAHHLILIPCFLRRGRIAAYLAALLLVTALLSLACTLLISLVYDVLWGPDPLRFGFATNLVMELFGVVLHLVAVAAGVWLWTTIRGEWPEVAAKSELPCPRG